MTRHTWEDTGRQRETQEEIRKENTELRNHGKTSQTKRQKYNTEIKENTSDS